MIDTRNEMQGLFVLADFNGVPDATGVLATLPVSLPDSRAICHYAAFQRHDPGHQVRTDQAIGGGANRVQGLRMARWGEAIEGGLFAILELADGDWLALLPVAGPRCFAWFAPDGDALLVKLGTLGTAPVAGDLPVLAWRRADNLYTACREAWQLALAHPHMRGRARLRDDKHYPDIFNWLGWCSWEQYKRAIDADLLVDTARRLNASELPVRFMLVDDGHILRYPPEMAMRDGQLASFEPLRETFPDGWGPLLAERRSDGLRWFGLWQNFNGYWGRIAVENELGADIDAHLMDVPAGGRLPRPSLPDALAFYEGMVGTAAQAGFDFVKVDDQAQSLPGYAGVKNPAAAVASCSQALERTAAARVNGLINCMAHGPINAFNTSLSAVTRCSEDYVVNDAWRAKAHLHNSYQNMLWLGPTVWGDHDMFHSSDRFAGRMMAVSKAMSGGPVYLSDDPDDFDPDTIRPLCDAAGRLYRPLAPAVPLPRCAARDPFEEAEPYIVAAPLANGVAAVVAYNLTEPEQPVGGRIDTRDYRDAAGLLDTGKHPWTEPDEGLVLYDWYAQEATLLEEPWRFHLEGFADRLLLLCPVRHGWAIIGRADTYLSAAAVDVVDVRETDLLVRSREACDLTVWHNGALRHDPLQPGLNRIRS